MEDDVDVWHYAILELHAGNDNDDTVPWPHWPNKYVFGNRVNWPCDSPRSLRLGGRMLQTCGPAVAKVLSPKMLRIRLTIWEQQALAVQQGERHVLCLHGRNAM